MHSKTTKENTTPAFVFANILSVSNPARLVVALEFESLAKSKEWYNSKEFQADIAGRLETTVGGLVFVDGG